MILVTGAGGQLASEFEVLLGDSNAIFATQEDLDICDALAVSKYFDEYDIKTVINCAAYTNVDKAEDEKELAFAVNAKGVKVIANACANKGAFMLHFSTDYVFDGVSSEPYAEDYLIKPNSVYGRSKADGELAIYEANVNACIIRVAWLYSSFGHNFVKTMKKLTAERDLLRVVFDQVGTPTYAKDVAEFVVEYLAQLQEKSGVSVYHYSNEGVCSWYDFAKEISECSGNSCDITPIRSSEYPQKAQRPNYSVFDKSKIKSEFNIKIPHWKESLELCLQKLS